MIKWALMGIAQGDLNKVEGFADLDGSTKSLISIYKAQLVKSAKAAGVEVEGVELAKLISQKIKEKLTQKAEYTHSTFAESLFNVKIDSVI